MTSKLKCPFCQQELDTSKYYIRCHNPRCDTTAEMEGTEELWQELIRTRKALEIAVDALKSAHNYYEYCIQSEDISRDTNWDCTAMNMDDDISEALEQITALEQKE